MKYSDFKPLLESITEVIQKNDRSVSPELLAIAKEEFDVQDLEMRNSDRLDFLDVSKASIASALNRAYRLGQQSKGQS